MNTKFRMPVFRVTFSHTCLNQQTLISKQVVKVTQDPTKKDRRLKDPIHKGSATQSGIVFFTYNFQN